MSNIITIALDIDISNVEFVTVDWVNEEASIGLYDAEPIDTKDLEAVYKIIDAKREYSKRIDDLATKLSDIEAGNSPVLGVDLDGRKYCSC